MRRGRNDLLLESDCEWVTPSGWGVPHPSAAGSGRGWQAYDAVAVDSAAAALVTMVAVGEHADREEEKEPSTGALPIVGLVALSLGLLAALAHSSVKQNSNLGGGQRSSSSSGSNVRVALNAGRFEMQKIVSPKRASYQEI